MVVYSAPLITVIVPVYNVEKYLNRCVDSILNQTLTNLEIILVNDGSTDNSPNICNKYRNQDSRIKVIHKENARVAAARNDGIKIAQGKYISFIDSDDWIECNMLEKMYECAEKVRADFVMCDYAKKGITSSYSVTQPIDGGFYDRSRIETKLFSSLIMFDNIEFPPTISNWTCLFNRDFLIENNLYYDEDIHYCEDSIFGSKAMYKANRFYYMKNQYFYNYFYNPSSTTTVANLNKWNSYIKINERLEDYFNSSNFDFSNQIKVNMVYFILNFLGEISKTNLTILEKYFKCKEIMNNERVKTSFKGLELNNISFKLSIVIKIIKYRLAFIYSMIFFRN